MRNVLLIGCLLAAAGCGDSPVLAPLETDSASQALASSGFTFLSPLASGSAPAGTFAPGVRPLVRVEDSSGNVVLEPRVREHAKHGIYRAEWRTSNVLAPGLYRIAVLLQNGEELGSVDVELRGRRWRGSGKHQAGTFDVGSTVRIRFRIETTAVDADADGVYDWLDNCPTDANADQLDANGNAQGDVCEQRPVRITAPGEAWGHHSDAEDACDLNWNACGDAETCALWACLIQGYPGLVSYGASAGCTQFTTCNLIFDGPNNGAQMNWGAWCDVMGVTDIDCEALP